MQALLAETLAGGGQRAVVETTSTPWTSNAWPAASSTWRWSPRHARAPGLPRHLRAYLEAKAGLLDLLRPDGAHPKREPWSSGPSSTPTTPATNPLPRAPLCRSCPSAWRPTGRGAGPGRAPGGWSTTCRVVTPWGEGRLDLPLPGEFNVYNALAAIAAGGTLGAPLPAPWTPCGATRVSRDGCSVSRVGGPSPWWSTSPTPRTP